MFSGNGTIDYDVEAHTLDAHKTSAARQEVHHEKLTEITPRRGKIQTNTLTVAADASLATEFDMKSRIAALIWFGDNLIYGFSKKSTLICDSSTEAEIDALNFSVEIANLLRYKIERLVNMTVKIEILTDSKATIGFLKQVYVKPRQNLLESE